jgi:hypothetical protein
MRIISNCSILCYELLLSFVKFLLLLSHLVAFFGHATTAFCGTHCRAAGTIIAFMLRVALLVAFVAQAVGLGDIVSRGLSRMGLRTDSFLVSSIRAEFDRKSASLLALSLSLSLMGMGMGVVCIAPPPAQAASAKVLEFSDISRLKYGLKEVEFLIDNW